MSYASTILADSPRVYYTLGDASGNPQDSSGNNLHITNILGGSATYGVTGPVAGITAMSLNGQALERTDDNLLDLGDVYTLEAWIKLNATGRQHAIICKEDNAYYDRIQTTGAVALIRANQSGIMISTTTITDTTTWHHVVAVKNGASAKLYIDGNDAGGTYLDVAPCGDNAFNLLIGADNPALNADTCNMQVGHCAVYPTALTGTKVLAHYNAAHGGGTTYRRFFGPAQLTGSAATIYTAPSNARVLGIHAANPTGSPVDITVSIGTDAAATRVYDGYSIAADSYVQSFDPYDLAAGNTIQAWASSAGAVVLTISGWEKST